MKQYPIECGDCKAITVFNKKEIDVEYISGIGGDSFIMRLSDKEYICEHCGSELYI